MKNSNRKIYIFGNGNIRYSDFGKFYIKPLTNYLGKEVVSFLLCDFRGVNTLAMEFLKHETPNVSIFHIGERPRYLPDKYKTKVSSWNIIGGFDDDESRDNAAIKESTHFVAIDFNSNEKRISGTQKNIELCLTLGKIRIE